MAGMDYFNCCLCECRIFYDASIDWYCQAFKISQVVGLCKSCGKDHEFILVKKPTGKHKEKRIKYSPIKFEQIDFRENEEIFNKEG